MLRHSSEVMNRVAEDIKPSKAMMAFINDQVRCGGSKESL